MRRLIIEEPQSAAAVWSRRLAIFALAVAATGAVIIWRTGRGGLSHVIGAVVLASLLLGFPAWLALQSIRLPLMNDISTDLTDPPAFSRSSAALAVRGPLTPKDVPESVRDEQRRAYPDIQPIILDLESEEAYRLVLQAVAARGFRLIDQTRPGGRSGIGRIDAVDRTLLMGFPDDIAIRIRPLAGQTRIDIRSVSRFGRHDFGQNARRIRRFAQELQTQLDAR